MLRPLQHACFLMAGLSSGALALGQLQVEGAAVGQRTLILTVDDSIQAPDLAKIRIEGYEIENAVFVEEMGPDTLRFAPGYLDLTLPGHGKVVEYAPSAGTLVLELPSGILPAAGGVVADTAFGGLMRKIVEVEGQSQAGATGRRWALKTVEADFPDAVLDCDIAFRTRIDLNQAIGNILQSQEVLGSRPDGSSATAQLDIALKGAQVLFQPMITGRIQVRNGKVGIFRFQVSGDCETMAEVKAEVSGSGDFEYEEELPGKAPILMPIGSGLFLRVRNRPFLRLESHSPSEDFAAHGEFRIRNSIKGELGFNDGQWRPMAENKMTWSNRVLRHLSGNGEIKISLKPRIEMLLEGSHGPVFTFDSYARFSSTPASALPRVSGTMPAGAPAPGAVPPGSPVLPGTGARGTANQELLLGSNIFMETRTNFTGPASVRNFLLFNREQSVLSPPREGTLALKEGDSSRINLHCQTYPKSDYYIIQAKLGGGPWETLLDRAVFPKIRMSQLKPNSPYRFRALGVNALGIGPAFPPEGMAFNTPALNRPPFQPVARFPDSGAVLSDSLPVLAWKGGDPDAGAKVLYTVFLDTRYPPLSIHAGGLTDTSLGLADLKPGTTYFWKVAASDGIDRSEGPVRSFTTKAAEAAAPLTVPAPSAYPVVFLPKGSYRREDGRMVQVGPLFLGRFEVTQAEYEKVQGRNPSYHLQDSLPVDRITWEEAEAFCRETGGRLPTEAEWEYAARAGSSSSFYWGGEPAGDYAWYRDNSDNRTQKVGRKKPNAWGLYDMAGNVFEWVQDWYGEYSPAELDHPRGPGTGTAKVIRGASWYSESGSLSLTARYNNRPGFRNFKVGFRCAKDPERAVLNERYRPDPASATGAQTSELAAKADPPSPK